MGRHRLVLSPAITLVFFAVAAHAAPDRYAEPEQWIRVGNQAGPCACQVLDANTTTFPMTFAAYWATGAGAGPRPICYGWKNNVVVTASDEVTLCWTLTTSVTLGSQTTRARTWVNDTTGGSDGEGACFTLGGAGTWTGHPDYMRMFASVTSTTVGGYRAGICSANQRPYFPGRSTAKIPDYRVPFCTNGTNGDCTEAGVSGGTCSTINTDAERTIARDNGCAFLVAKATNASTEVCACPEF